MKKRKEVINKKAVLLVVVIILAILLALAFFLPKKPSTTNNSTNNSNTQANQTTPKQECEAKGGIWGKLGDIGEFCNLPTSDAGKFCSSSKECEGDCLANLTKPEWNQASQGIKVNKKGNCTEWKVTIGCKAFVDDGIVRIMCVG